MTKEREKDIIDQLAADYEGAMDIDHGNVPMDFMDNWLEYEQEEGVFTAQEVEEIQERFEYFFNAAEALNKE